MTCEVVNREVLSHDACWALREGFAMMWNPDKNSSERKAVTGGIPLHVGFGGRKFKQ